MKTKDIKALSEQELTKTLTEMKSGLNSMKFNHSLSPLENPMVIRKSRKTVAKILTEINARKNK